jgi:hypothetical protein
MFSCFGKVQGQKVVLLRMLCVCASAAVLLRFQTPRTPAENARTHNTASSGLNMQTEATAPTAKAKNQKHMQPWSSRLKQLRPA